MEVAVEPDVGFEGLACMTNRLSSKLLGAFRYRSGRVIGFSRAVMTCAFLIALWIDPSQPSQYPETAYVVIAAYAAWSLLLLAMIWRNWSFDARSAAFAHVVDIIAFGLMVLLTDGYTSPFYTFFVFIILSATLRWGWRETAATAVAVTTIFFVAGLASLGLGIGEFELNRFTFRGTSLAVLSFILIWFGVNLLGPQHRWKGRALADSPIEPAPPISEALEFMAAETGARTCLLVWEEREEPWTSIARLEHGELSERRAGPEEFGESVTDGVLTHSIIFDAERSRIRGPYRRMSGGEGPARVVRLAAREGIMEGIASPIEVDAYSAVLIVGEIDGMCVDDLARGEEIANEISLAFDRYAHAHQSQQVALGKAQSRMAMELHDSVMQSLSGVQLRLKGLENAIDRPAQIRSELVELREDVALDQRTLRWLIERSRGTRPDRRRKVELRESVALLCRRLGRQWGIECDFGKGEEILASLSIEHDLHQILRETTANAVRHGDAKSLTVILDPVGDGLEFVISDDGAGFPSTRLADQPMSIEAALLPQSLHERVQSLHGRLAIDSSRFGSKVRIILPLE